MPGGPELIWIVLIFFLLFGAKKLPEFARSAGESLKEFKKATREAMAEEQAQPVDPPRRLETPAEEQPTASNSV